ncbi:hypothetical protein OEZ86_002860 [Tetradesmus obliquus]|nr:hypothetical protein OEZ86_002860 [Tetradesmus obliquus]
MGQSPDLRRDTSGLVQVLEGPAAPLPRALAAPFAVAGFWDGTLDETQQLQGNASPGDQLFVLRAALDIAEGCGVEERFEAADVLAASALLPRVCGTAVNWGEAQTASAAASALVSLMKRAGAAMQAAGSAQGQAGIERAADKAAVAARCFPAAVPSIMEGCLGKLADSLAAASASAAAAAAAGRDAGRLLSQQQSRASAALLAVLLARSLVMLADAQEAAAGAAGSTSAQLFAR